METQQFDLANLDLFLNERGNTWLCSEECISHVGYFRLGESKWLEVSVYPDNYPGFHV